MSTSTQYQTQTTETLNQHVSIRRYRDEGIPEALMHSLLEAARRSPTSSNVQAYSFVVVRNPKTKQGLAQLTGNQRHVAECPVFVACCADLTRMASACEMHGSELVRNTELSMVATIDASIAGMSLATAAESFGLGTVMIGGIRNNPEGVAELLQLPHGVYVVYGLCIGWPDEAHTPPQKPRMPESLIIHHEAYDNSDRTQALRDHDHELAEHYRSEGRESQDEAWTGVIAEKFSKANRPRLHQILAAMGFPFS